MELLISELLSPAEDSIVAYRHGRRFTQAFEPVSLRAPIEDQRLALRRQGVVLITGGLGGMGLVLAHDLAQHYAARLILTSRRGLPPRNQWDERVSSGDDDDVVARQIRAVQSLENLRQDVEIARSFTPMSAEERESLGEKVRPEASDGRHEWFKSTQYYDSSYHRDQHSFPPVGTVHGR